MTHSDVADLQDAILKMSNAVDQLYRALQTNTEEIQRLRASNDEIADHCCILAEALWHSRGRNDELERQVEWFRNLAGTRQERMARDTPVEGLPPDADEG